MKNPLTFFQSLASGLPPTGTLRLRRVIALLALGGSASAFGSQAQSDEPVATDPRTPYFHLRSDRAVGDRGEISLDVSTPVSRCGPQLRFERAEIEVLRNRFGDVQFVALPDPGCEDCSPLVARWMHEPTGHLEFNVNVYRRQINVPCTEDQ